MVASGEIFLYAVSIAAGLTFCGSGVEIKFKLGFRKDVGTNIAAFHDEIAELSAGTLLLFHPLADAWDSGDSGNNGTGLGRTNLFLRVISINEQARLSVLTGELGVPLVAVGGDGLGVAGVDGLLEAMPSESSVHGAGIDVDVVESFGNKFRVGTFAAGTGTVDGDDDLSLIHI